MESNATDKVPIVTYLDHLIVAGTQAIVETVNGTYISHTSYDGRCKGDGIKEESNDQSDIQCTRLSQGKIGGYWQMVPLEQPPARVGTPSICDSSLF